MRRDALPSHKPGMKKRAEEQRGNIAPTDLGGQMTLAHDIALPAPFPPSRSSAGERPRLRRNAASAT